MSLLNIGISGLQVSQTSLRVTGNNIANADVQGYSRQRAELITRPEQFIGVGFVGSGSRVEDITRVVDEFLQTQIRLDEASFNALDTLAGNLRQLDKLLGDEDSRLSGAISDFFSAVEASSQDPTSEPARQVVLSMGQSLALRFQTLYARIQQQNLAVNEQLASHTAQVSKLSQGIAKLNLAIAVEEGRGGAQPNQLLDQRDELVRQLSELVSIRVVSDAAGALSVFVGNGQPLVVGSEAAQLGVIASPAEPSNYDITFIDLNGLTQNITNFISGGKIGGLIDFRDTNLGDTYNSMGRIAIALADAMNSQNALGIDLDGNFGGNIFTDVNDPVLAAGRVVIDITNPNAATQRLAVTITDTTAITTSDYELNIIDADADANVDYRIIRRSDNAVFTGELVGTGVGQSIVLDGISIDINPASSALQFGDNFTLRPTRNAAGNINVVMDRVQELAYAAPIATNAATGNTGGGVISAGTMIEVLDGVGEPFGVPGQLSPPLLIRFTAANAYTVYDNSNPAAPLALFANVFTPGQRNDVFLNAPGAPPQYTGFQVQLSGYPAVDDEFTINFNSNGISDNRNAIALGGVRTRDIVDGGRTNLENSYGSLVSRVGTRTSQAQISGDAAQSLLLQSRNSRDAVSGVNLDEEAANLIKFEQLYNASAQIINIARQTFDTLLAAFN